MRLSNGQHQLRLAICGAHSTGKSTLVSAVSEAMDECFVITGVVRELISEGYKFGRQTDLRSIMAYVCRQFDGEERAATSGSKLVVSDRTLLDAVAYVSTNQSFDACEIWPAEDLQFLKAIALRELRFYDAVVYVPIEFQLVVDGTRPEGSEYRKGVDLALQQTFADFLRVPLRVPLYRVTGKTRDRVDQVLAFVTELVNA